MKSPGKKIILASASPRREQLLREMGLVFTIKPSRLKEKVYPRLTPAQLVKKLALLKALKVAKQIKRGIIIGADTIVVRCGEILGKPRNPKHAREILGKLSGSYHYVFTGLALIEQPGGKTLVAAEKTRVKMKKLSPADINYHAGRHLDKAGGYAVQEEKDAFVEQINGCYYNVVGLPVELLKKMLKKLGFKLL
jgi:septum formation protein